MQAVILEVAFINIIHKLFASMSVSSGPEEKLSTRQSKQREELIPIFFQEVLIYIDLLQVTIATIYRLVNRSIIL